MCSRSPSLARKLGVMRTSEPSRLVTMVYAARHGHLETLLTLKDMNSSCWTDQDNGGFTLAVGRRCIKAVAVCVPRRPHRTPPQ